MKKLIYLSLIVSLCSCTKNIQEGRIEYLTNDKAFIEINNDLEIITLSKFEYYKKIKEGDYITINKNNIYYNKEKTETLKEEIIKLQSKLRH